ncbi:glucose dehydrogenase [FAD, quinone]-like [Diorhabda carinulata]|uniref:glucose dehydrogenase [FAD, quinone]-like n=1 Tax=Diorhabda carinulata TaxID=1163345 RepID=UPI0025A2CC40|nr:glucose dehydrogenase [FAD, quinone]-like [Diorhabda carinulata]
MKYTKLYSVTTLLFLTFVRLGRTQLGTFNYYKNLLTTSVEQALNFTPPTNAYMYKPKNDTILDYGTYDFVIIGAGVSGSIIANRLSEITTWRILLIEPGDFSDGGLIQVPGFFMYHNSTKYNWAYTSVPQKNICLGNPNQTCPIARGKGVGGGSLINALVYCRGPPGDFDKLAGLAPIDLSYHGKVGLLHVEHGLPMTEFGKQFFYANREMGYELIDYNGPNMIGATYIQRFTRHGEREDFGSIFISPYLGRPSLKVITGSYVIKIEINKVNKVAESVLFTNGVNTYRVKASKEIILSAGTIASPQILMLSGVGPQNHLKDVNIEVIQDLEVGSKLKDHIDYLLPFSSNMKFHQPTLFEELSDYFKGTGYLTYPPSLPQALGFYQINKTETGVPDFEIFSLVPQDLTGMLYNSVKDANTTLQYIGTEFFTVKSTGTLRLKNNNPYEYPLIDMNAFSDKNDDDIDMVYQSIRFIFKLINTKPYRKYNVQYIDDNSSACSKYPVKSKKYWYCLLKEIAFPGLHMVGTCSMGIDPKKGAVVDSKLRVFGIKNLRVADASVYPELIAGHSTIPCATLAEKISDDIKRDHGGIVFED